MGKLGRLLGFRLYRSWTLSFLLGVAGCSSLVPGTLFFAEPSSAQTVTPPQYPGFPSETPTEIQPVTVSFDHLRREVMIPMRDGVTLHTFFVFGGSEDNQCSDLAAFFFTVRVLNAVERSIQRIS